MTKKKEGEVSSKAPKAPKVSKPEGRLHEEAVAFDFAACQKGAK